MQMPAEEKNSVRRDGFVLARLPQLEMYFYYAIWIAHSFGALLLVYKITYDLQRSMQAWLPRSDYVPSYHIDTSDPEWSFYRMALPQMLFANFAHIGVFFAVPRLFTKRTSQYVLIAFWLAVQLYLNSLKCLLTFAVLAISAVIASVFSHTQLFAWAFCISFVMKANRYAPFSPDPRIYYREFNFYLYGAIKVLNFCIHLTRNKVTSLNEAMFIRYMQYLLYPPYTSMLIVIYEDFDKQMADVEQQQEITKGMLPSSFSRELIWKFARLVMWYFAFEFVLHFIYVHSFFNVPFSPFNRFSNYELAATAYVHGQMFFWKYVIIFGVPSWFALVDGMTPPKPPICISRVSRYSRMWRYFDRGLYQFLKIQVYMPLMGDLNGAYVRWRRLGAMVGAFMFVLAWHGTSSNYVCWVLLSGSELCIERIGYAIASTSAWGKFSLMIGRRNQRRVIAFAMLATVIPGIFGVFFFLGRDGFGQLVFKKVLIDGLIDALHLRITLNDSIPSAGFVFVHLILLGYCFNQVCLQLDESINKEEQLSHIDKKAD